MQLVITNMWCMVSLTSEVILDLKFRRKHLSTEIQCCEIIFYHRKSFTKANLFYTNSHVISFLPKQPKDCFLELGWRIQITLIAEYVALTVRCCEELFADGLLSIHLPSFEEIQKQRSVVIFHIQKARFLAWIFPGVMIRSWSCQVYNWDLVPLIMLLQSMHRFILLCFLILLGILSGIQIVLVLLLHARWSWGDPPPSSGAFGVLCSL